MVRAAIKGDFATARKLHYKLLSGIDLLFAEGNPTGVKFVLSEMGLIRNTLRLPLVPTSGVLEGKLKDLINEIINNSHGLPLVFPVHPRTAKILEHLEIKDSQLHTIDPLGYLEFNYLVEHAKAVVTDSGGITEETTVMGIPCMTLRDNTERPETIDIGTNELLGTDPKAIKPAMDKLFSGEWKKGEIPELWDGHTSGRIVERLLSLPAFKS